MVRRSPIWTRIQQEQERKRKERRKLEEWSLREMRRAEQERLKAERDRERRELSEQKRREAEVHENAAADALERTRRVEARTVELSTLLISVLDAPIENPLRSVRRRVALSPFDPGGLAVAEPEPQWAEYVPEPGLFGGAFRSSARIERERESAGVRFEKALKDHREREERRLAALTQAQADHEAAARREQEEVERHNAEVDRFEADVRRGQPDAVCQYYDQVLARSDYPDGFPHEYELRYQPDQRELLVQYRFPATDVIPLVREYRYVKARKEIREVAGKKTDAKELYASVVAQVALRTLRDCFDGGMPELVDVVVFNGMVDARDRATGRPIRECVVSVQTDRKTFEELVLDQLSPGDCLKYLKALVSPNPYDLKPVKPVVDFDHAKYKFVEPADGIGDLDSRIDLLKMDPYQFEELIRRLFEARGLQAWRTQRSGDDGIDAVAWNDDPVLPGECIISVKRYKGRVDPEAVRSLGGMVDERRASRGVLVTTSWVGPTSHRFAKANNRITIIEGPELKHLLAEHLGMDVRIDLNRPRR